MSRRSKAGLILMLLTASNCDRPSRQLSSSVTVKLPPARAAAPGFSTGIAGPNPRTRA